MENRVGDQDINRMIGLYGDTILRICFVYLKDVQLAEDAVQDTFLKVYRSYDQFQGESQEKTWITRIAINTCKNYLRTTWFRRVNVGQALAEIPAEEDKYEDDSLICEIMNLSPKYKEVILLYYYQDFKISEIAEILHIPSSTVSVRLKRGRDMLKKRLEGWYIG